jgi:ABC-type multidrug transport system fused ATPase/permease subunit
MNIIFKILKFLNKKEKQRALILLILVLLTGIFDSLGIASIFPFISILADPNLINNPVLNSLSVKFDEFGLTNYLSFTKIFGYGVFFFFLFSTFLRFISNFIQIRFIHMRGYSLEKRILSYYLNQRYVWFSTQSPSNLSKNILSEVAEFLDKAFMPIINIIAYGVVIILLLGILFYNDPETTLVILLIILTPYLVIYKILKKILKKKGNIRLESNRLRYKILDELLSGIKLVKIRNLETYFLEIFAKYSYKFAKSASEAQAITQLPRFLIEAIAFGGLLIFILIKIETQNFLNTVPIITLIAFAGYRMLPAFQQVYIAISQIKYSNIIVNQMSEIFEKINKTKRSDRNSNEMIFLKKSIQLSNVGFKYKNSKNLILDKINLEIPYKSKVGIIGTTGGGKTTLVDLIIGLLEPTEGQVFIDNIKLNQENKYNWYKQIGYITQDIFLFDDDIYKNVAFGIDEKKIDRTKVEEVCKVACLHDFINNDLPNKYYTEIGNRGIRLSGGQKQRLNIARCLYNDPSLLIMDEATSALDTKTESKIINNMNKLKNNVTTIIIAHRHATLKNCDLIINLEKGKIIKSGIYRDFF